MNISQQLDFNMKSYPYTAFSTKGLTFQNSLCKVKKSKMKVCLYHLPELINHNILPHLFYFIIYVRMLLIS